MCSLEVGLHPSTTELFAGSQDYQGWGHRTRPTTHHHYKQQLGSLQDCLCLLNPSQKQFSCLGFGFWVGNRGINGFGGDENTPNSRDQYNNQPAWEFSKQNKFYCSAVNAVAVTGLEDFRKRWLEELMGLGMENNNPKLWKRINQFNNQLGIRISKNLAIQNYFNNKN